MGTNGKGKFRDGHGREPEELAINPAEARQELVAALESTKAEIESLFAEFKTANQDQPDLITGAEAALAKAMKKIDQLKSREAVVARKETLVASLENLKSKGQGATEQLSVLEQRLKNAERAAELIQHSLEEIQALDQNLDLANLERQILEINANLERKLEQLKVVVPETAPAAPAPEPEVPAEEADQTKKWFEGQERLKMVDISPEKIKELLSGGDILTELRLLLSKEEGAGVEGLQTNVAKVLRAYFAEHNLELADQGKTALEGMINNLSTEVARQIADSFMSSLDYQAQTKLGWFEKTKSKFSVLMGARVGATLAVGIGAAVLAPVLAPAFLGTVGTVALAGGLAGGVRFGLGKLFKQIHKWSHESARMSKKEQKVLEKARLDILNNGIGSSREFINLDILTAVMANTIRTNTSADFRTGRIMGDDGEISTETTALLKQNIKDLLDNDPRYAGLTPEARAEEEKKLFTLWALELTEQTRTVFDVKGDQMDPKLIRGMQRVQEVLSGRVGLENEWAQAGVAALVGAGLRMAYTQVRPLAMASAAMSGATTAWAMGSTMENEVKIIDYYQDIEDIINSYEPSIRAMVDDKDLLDDEGNWNGAEYRTLQNAATRLQGYLALKKDDQNNLIADPVLRARAENFIHQFNQYNNREISVGDQNIYNADQNEVLKQVQAKTNFYNQKLIEELAERVQETNKSLRNKKMLVAALGAAAGAFGSWFLMTHHTSGSDQSDQTETPRAEEGGAAKVSPETSRVVSQDSLVSPEDSLAQQAASTVNSTQAAGINPAETVSAGGAGAAAAAQAAAEHAGVNAQHFENVVHTEQGASADSIWRSTRDIVKAHPADFGYTGTNDAGEIARFAETQTANLVHQLDQSQSGNLADLVHEGDKVSIDFTDDGKPVLHFETSSGLKAGHLAEMQQSAPSAVEQTPMPEVVPVVPVTPTLENISSDAFVNKVFESSQDVQEKFLHDIDPNHFTGANNKAEIFLKTIAASQKIKLEDINSLEELQKHLAAFDRLVDNKSLPGNAWTPRLFSDGQGHEIYALVQAKGGLFSFLGEKQYLVDTTGGKPFSISETGLRNMLENHNVNIDASQNVLTENLPVEPKAEVIEPSAETQIVHEGGIDFAGTYSAAERANILEHLRGENIEFENLRTQFAQLAVNPEYNQNQNWSKFVDLYKQSLQEHLSDYSKIKADLVNPNIQQLHLETNISGNMTLEEAANMKAEAEIKQLLVDSNVRNQVDLAKELLDREIPVVPELATSVDTTFEQLSGLKEGAEFHDTEDNVFTKINGKIFRYNPLGQPNIEVRNQVDLDNFYK